MGVVRDKVTEKSSHVRTKALDAAVALQGAVDDRGEGVAALVERAQRLCRRYGGTIELRGDLAAFSGSLQPHHADIVHVSHDCGNRTALAIRSFGFPRRRFNVAD